jgi:hypothetical protein
MAYLVLCGVANVWLVLPRADDLASLTPLPNWEQFYPGIRYPRIACHDLSLVFPPVRSNVNDKTG